MKNNKTNLSIRFVATIMSIMMCVSTIAIDVSAAEKSNQILAQSQSANSDDATVSNGGGSTATSDSQITNTTEETKTSEREATSADTVTDEGKKDTSDTSDKEDSAGGQDKSQSENQPATGTDASTDARTEKSEDTKSDEEQTDKTDEELAAEEEAERLKEEEAKKLKEEEEKKKKAELLENEQPDETEYTVVNGVLTTFNPGTEFITDYAVILPEDVEGIAADAFGEYTSQVKSIVLPSSFTYVGENTFKGFTSLSKVEFKSTSSLTVEAKAFKDCALTEIRLAEGLQNIPANFMKNAGFGADAKVYVPASVRTIGMNAFGKELAENETAGNSVAEVIIAENSSLNSINVSAFINAVSLKTINLPDSLTVIGKQAFENCTNLESVNIFTDADNENSLLSAIDERAFYNCSKLTNVSIPKKVINIGDYAFGYGAITAVKIKATNLTTVGMNIFKGNNISNIAFAEGMEKIPAVFYHAGFAANTTVSIPASVKVIADDAFNTIPSLTGITFNGTSLTTIGARAFEDCGLTNIDFPASVTTIGAGAFNGCNSITALTLPNNLKTVGANAFKNCSSLNAITFPVENTQFDKSAFADCKALTTVNIPGNIKKIGNNMFEGCTSLTDLTIGSGVTSIGAYAFHTTSIRELTIPDSVTEVGIYAFARCDKLTSLVMSANVKTLPYRSIGLCSILTDLYLGDKITSVIPRGDEYAFEGTNSAMNIYVSSATSATYKALQQAVDRNLLNKNNIITTNKISYELYDGTAVGVYPTSYTTGVVGATIDLTNPTKEHYSFEGWFLDSQFTKPIGTKINSFKYRFTISDFDGDVTLFAKWDGPHYYAEIIEIDAPQIFVMDATNTSRNITGESSAVEIFESDKIYLKTETVGATIDYTITENSSVIEEGTFSDNYLSLEGGTNTSPKIYTLVATANYLDKTAQSVVTLKVYGDEIPTNYDSKYENGLWMTYKGELFDSSKVSMVYTKTSRRFQDDDIKVYYGKKLLTLNKDYGISYGNNVKVANYDDAKAPFINVVGKGNYSGSIKKTFSIVMPSESAIRLTSGNTIVELSETRVEYDGTPKCPALTISYKYRDENKQLTTKQLSTADYDIYYTNNLNAGTGKIKIVFNGINYYGEINKNFTITKPNIGKAFDEHRITVLHKDSVTYSGSNYYGLEDIYLTSTNYHLVEKKDYTYSISPNIKRGTAKITISGRGNFSGRIVKEYNITAAKLNDGKLEVRNFMPPVADGRRGVYKPISFAIYYNNAQLKSNEYRIEYFVGNEPANGSTVCDLDSEVTMRIRGRNNFSDADDSYVDFKYKLAKSYDFTNQDYVTAQVNDYAYTGKANKYKPVIRVKNNYTNKNLALNRDYTIEKYEYVYDTVVQRNMNRRLEYITVPANTEIDKTDIIQAGTKIRVTLKGKNSYEGTITKIYKVGYNMASTSAVVAPQTYTGSRITPAKTDITLKYRGKVVPASQYNITSFNAENVRVGTGYITITGTNEYIGSKKIAFKITRKSVNYTVVYEKGSDDRIKLPKNNKKMKNSLTANGAVMSNNLYIAPEGYEFAGWNLTDNKIPETYNEYQSTTIDFVASKPNVRPTLNLNLSTYPAGTTVIVYPYFKPVQYRLSYSLKGGQISKSSPTTYTYTDGATILTPTKKGYTFAGWYYDGACKTRPVEGNTIPTGKTGNLTVYAKWEKK